LAERTLHELDADYRRILDRQFPIIAEEWAANCTTIGREISVDMGPRRVFGRAEALDESGALLVRTQHGRMERVMGGDVTIAK
jgi:BirA family biotin operon repressor/biotin-[acetyl-CoA-carboxylase] ligase